MNMKKNLYLILLLLFTACEEKVKPNVSINPTLSTPISCMKLNTLGLDVAWVDRLKELYAFDDGCDLTLSISSKRDIVCNSTHNMQMKNVGKFPKSYLRMEIRKGLKMQYSYYVDLYSNVDSDDVSEAFARLKKDLIEMKMEDKK